MGLNKYFVWTSFEFRLRSNGSFLIKILDGRYNEQIDLSIVQYSEYAYLLRLGLPVHYQLIVLKDNDQAIKLWPLVFMAINAKVHLKTQYFLLNIFNKPMPPPWYMAD